MPSNDRGRDRQAAVLDILSNLKGLDPLKELFWNELNYDRVNEPISRRGWTDTATKSLADDPVVFAGGGENDDFKIILARLDSEHVRLGLQRPVINRLLRDFPYALFVFSNRDRSAWHFVNVKYDDDPKRRQLFRRISVASGDRLRTASERIAILDLQAIGDQASPLIIQDRHDEAFDVEKVTKKFFEDFSNIFEVVAKDIRKHNDWEEEIVEKETQTLLNRLLFLYFIQRKGWLNRERDYLYKRFTEHLKADPDGSTYYSSFLHLLFIRLSTEMEEAASVLGDVPFLNGGLFDDEYGGQQRENLRRRTRMKISNRIFKRVFDDVLEKYNFTVREDTPLNQDVSIDPEMLGKIFESLVLQLEQSDAGGKTSRHDTGSYYTPRPIVHYLCREALRVCLESKGEDRHQNIAKLLAIDASDGIDADQRAVLDECLSSEQAKALRDDLDSLRACDLAVGSGAFPLGLLHELVNLSRLCEARSRGRDPVEVDVDWLYDTKSKFIERAIYGVDIQERAVEICKLRLWLSLMVDLDIGVDVDDCSASSFRTAIKRKVTPLPNLDYKVRRADSLIDQIHGQPVRIEAHADPRFHVILSRLNEAKREFYRAKKLEQKREWRFKILEATAELGQHEIAWERNRLGELIADEKHSARLSELDHAMRELGNMREQIKAANKLKAHQQDDALQRFSRRFDDPEKPTFVWQLDFAEAFHRFSGKGHESGDLLSTQSSNSSGFDVIVANPPYVDSETMVRRHRIARDDYVARYTVARGNWDFFVIFIERGLQLLRSGGVLSYIVPNKLIGAPYGAATRALLAENAICELRDYSAIRVFTEAAVYPVTLVVKKSMPGETVNMTKMASLDDVMRENAVPASRILSDTAWSRYFDTSEVVNFVSRLAQHPRLAAQPGIEVGAAATVSEAYLLKPLIRELTAPTSKPFKKLVNTGTIDPYRILWGEKRTQYIKDAYVKPIVYDPDIRRVSERRLRQAQSTKIIIGGMTRVIEAAFDVGECIAGKSTVIIHGGAPDNLKFILALMNSDVVSFWFQSEFSALSLAGGFLRINAAAIGQVPVPGGHERRTRGDRAFS